MKGKKHLSGRETSQTIAEQEGIVLEAGGTIETETATFQEEVVDEAERQGVGLHDVKSELDKAEQKSLLPDMAHDNGKGPTVQGRKMLAEYVRPHFSMNEGTRLCALEFSFPLIKEHKGKLPKPVEDAWKFIDKRGYKGVVGIELPNQVIDIWLAPDDDEIELHLGVAELDKVTIALVKEIGKGAGEKVVRFSFHAVVEATKNVYTFASTQFGNELWIEMGPSQGELSI